MCHTIGMDEEHEAEIERRLNAHAREIRALKKQLAELLGKPLPVDKRKPVEGVYVPKPTCLVCGEMKPSSRVALTCIGCSRERQNKIVLGALEPVPNCGNCGRKIGQGLGKNLLCSACSKSFREWKKG